LAAPWTPERTAAVTRIPVETLREMVCAYREADGAAFYSSTGVSMGGNGLLAFWIQEAINAISGNLDRMGGTLVGRGVIDFLTFGKKKGLLLGGERSRVGDFPSVSDAFPGGILADEILTPGPGQLRALFVSGGNPLLSIPHAARLREALEQLDLLVVTDIFLNETASLAHYVLPAGSPLQRPDLPFVFPLMMGTQLRPYLVHRRTGRPLVVLKLAASLDGRTAAPDGSSRWITGPDARRDAHELRADSDAVLVGAGTVRADDPELTVRLDDRTAGLDRQPMRVVLGRARPDARVQPCLELGGELGDVLDELGRRGVLQLLVEGGATVARAFHRQGLVERYVLYLAPTLFGGDDGRAVFAGPGVAGIDDVWRGRVVDLRRVGADVRVDLEPFPEGDA
jgi:riboflavin biosynthesis pyrimidine reductase